MGADRNWLIKLIQGELEESSIAGKFEAHALASRLTAKLMDECDISPRVKDSGETVQQAAERGFRGRGGKNTEGI